MAKRAMERRAIAVCGKGGTGKTALVALMTKVLLRDKARHRLLLIDADPASSLPYTVGAGVKRTIAEIREEIIKRARKSRSEEEKAEFSHTLDYLLLEALTESPGFTLMVMGRQEGPGCFCPVNELLGDSIELITEAFDFILIDGEAGIEQINRNVIRAVDTVIVVTDPTARGFQTAALIGKILEDYRPTGCRTMGMVVNRVKRDRGGIKLIAQSVGLEILGYIPEDELITESDFLGRPLIELPDSAPSVVAIQNVIRRLNLI